MLSTIDFANKSVVLRTDYNVPICKDEGVIRSTKRIDSSLATINLILKGDPRKLIIISHLGRPSKKDCLENNLSLAPVRDYLETILNKPVCFRTLEQELDKNSRGEDNENRGSIVLLENIRYYREETENILSTTSFRKKLTSLGDVFVNDAFGCCHRSHSSIVGIDTPEKCHGLLIEKEVANLQDVFSKSGNKTVILGGSKVSDKIGLINNLIPKVDQILIGGGMAFTFWKFFGYPIGNSLLDLEGLEKIKKILDLAVKHNTVVYLPVDVVCNKTFSNQGEQLVCHKEEGVREGYMGLDIGPETREEFSQVVKGSDIVIWNGPLGVFEFENFSKGSLEVMNSLADNKGVKIIGGGDTASCCEQFGLADRMTHISTGGGASLELLEGKRLPGLRLR